MNNAKGTVFKYGDNVDTDVIIPARYLNSSDPAELATHCMEDIDKEFIHKVQQGDIIVAEKNFGCGSSREHAALVPLYLGVRAVITKSFARIHVANLINAGIMPLTFKNPEDYDKLSQGDDLVIENIYAGMDSGEMILQDKTSGEEIPLICSFTDRQKAILKAGGLLKYVGLGGK